MRTESLRTEYAVADEQYKRAVGRLLYLQNISKVFMIVTSQLNFSVSSLEGFCPQKSQSHNVFLLAGRELTLKAIQTQQIRGLFDSTVLATKEDITQQSKNSKPGTQPANTEVTSTALHVPNMAPAHVVIPRLHVDSHYILIERIFDFKKISWTTPQASYTARPRTLRSSSVQGLGEGGGGLKKHFCGVIML